MRTTRARAFKAIVATTASIFFMPAAAWASTIINLPTTTNITVEAGETLFVDYLVGGTTLTKSGAGRMEVAVIGNPDLTVIVNEGTFATAKASTLDLSENENVIFHLDANKTSALTTRSEGGTNFVTGVADADGRTDRTLSTRSGRPDPYLVPDGLNGLPAIDLGSLSNTAASGYGAALDFSESIANAYHVFYVFEDDPDAKNRAKSIGPCFYGTSSDAMNRRGYVQNGTNAPIHYTQVAGRAQGGNTIDGNAYGTGRTYNGVDMDHYAKPIPDGVHVMVQKINGTAPFDAMAGLGWSSASSYASYGGLKIGEIIFFSATVSDSAFYQTYLMRKWLDRGVKAGRVVLNNDSVLDVSARPLRCQLQIVSSDATLVAATNLLSSGYFDAGNPALQIEGAYRVIGTEKFLPSLGFASDAAISVDAATSRVARVDGSGTLFKDGVGALTVGVSSPGITALSVREGAKRSRQMNSIALLVMGGLWQLRFADGSLLDPSSCSVSTNGVGDVVYSSPEAMVAIRRTPVRGGFDLSGCVVSRGKTVKDFMLPARTGFDPEKIDRVAFPGKKFMGTGYSLKAEFFKRQTDTKRCAWEGVQVKGFGHRQVFGGGSAMRPLRDTPVPVVAAPGAEAFLGAEALSVVTNARFAVNRAPLTGQDCRVIVDSENGPLLCGLSLGGSGAVWRVCSASSADGEKARLALLRGCVRGILRESEKNRSERRKIALVRFPSHSGKIGFCPVPLASLRKMLREECGERFAYSELKSPQDIATAEASPDTLLVVNSYTETLPAENAADAPAAAERLKRYVRGGGHWLEPGGLSFFKAMVPREWMSIGGDYPGLFADFVHWKWKDGGTCTMMGVQPRPPHKPWGCPKPFVPGTLRIGGAVSGGWVEHGFCAWVRKGEKWLSPTVRVVTNLTLEAACDEYVRANTMDRPLSDKVRDASKLAVLKRAPLLFLGDGAAKCMAAIPHIPVPSIIHQSQYLKGGFDKEYPDHLPPRASYGTQEEMRAFVDALHAAGHFFSPYTNPTWWCDHPRGPTFLAAGEDPISLDEKGSPVYRYYGPNADGWSVCFWHSAVQAANRSTRRKFTVDVPCDILFQDECGARHQRYDFNEAAPHPTAYLEGMISMLEEDSQEIPLATEDGWDRVAREETALCGLSWGTVPLKETSILEKAKIPPHLWDIEAIPGRLFHDKCLFFLHDLGGFVNNDRSLAWCIALGYQLSYRCNAWHFTHDARAKAWYAKLHKIQQRIVARYAGRKLLSFRHDRSPLLARDDIEASSLNDDGVVLAEYEGGLRLAVNLGEVARTVDGCALPPYGFAELPAKQAKGGK